jgi:serine/threonine protein phosphatase PrpC
MDVALTAVGATHRGRVRSQNQDQYWIATQTWGVVVAVADGIGGYQGGAEASALAVAVLARELGSAQSMGPQRLRRAVEAANRTIFEVGRGRPELSGMGTTLTVCWVARSEVWVAHVGDSRAYRVGAEGLERLTTDHSVAAEMERSGTLSPEEAEQHPQRHVLTRAIGPFPAVEVEMTHWPWRPGDRLLLCSDGLFNAVPERRIHQLLRRFRGQAGVDALIQAALDEGGQDNVTVILVEDQSPAEVPDGR